MKIARFKTAVPQNDTGGRPGSRLDLRLRGNDTKIERSIISSGGGGDGLGDFDYVGHLGYIVDTEDMGAFADGQGDRRGGAEGAVGGAGLAGEPADETLAAGADEEAIAKGGESVEVFEEREVVLHGLAEADAGVEDDAVGGQAGGLGLLGAGGEEGGYLPYHVRVTGLSLHGFGGALHVHEDDGHPLAEGDLLHAVIGERCDVVEDGRPRIGGGPGNEGVAGVDADGQAGLFHQPLDHGDRAANLFVGGDGL